MAEFGAQPSLEIERLERLIHSHDEADLRAAAMHPELTEDLARALLQRRDLPDSVLHELSKNTEALKSRKVLVDLVGHPRTPRFISLPAARKLFAFEQMRLVLQPSVAADIKMALEQLIVERLANLSLGEKITLAKQGSTRIAEVLLGDSDQNVVALALNNPRLTEACVIRSLMRDGVDSRLVQAVARHPKWSLRNDVRFTLLRNPKTPMAVALQIAHILPADVARDAVFNSNLPRSVKTYLLAEIQNRGR